MGFEVNATKQPFATFGLWTLSGAKAGLHQRGHAATSESQSDNSERAIPGRQLRTGADYDVRWVRLSGHLIDKYWSFL